MTDKKDDPGKAVPPGTQPKKPSPIIDLKATVVESQKAATGEPGKGAEAAKPAASGSVPPTKPADGVKVGEAPKSAEPVKPAVAAAAATPASATKPAAATPPPKATSPGPVPPSRAGGFLSHMGAGLLGAVLALVGAPAVAPMLGVDLGGGTSPEISRRLAQLEQATGKAPAVPAEVGQRLSAGDARLAKLEDLAQSLAAGQAKIAADAKAAEERIGGAPADASARLGKLEAQLGDLVAAAGDPRSGRLPQLAQVTTKLGELETQIATRTAQVKTELLQQLDQRFARTGEQQESARSILAQRTQTVEQGLKSVTEEAAALRTGIDTLKADVDTRWRQVAKPADVQTAVGAVAAKVTALETSMQGVVKSEQDRNATAGNILLSLELANLKRALDRGGRYASELAAVKKLAGGKLDLTAFEGAQESGVPNLATLGSELSSLAHGMLDAEAQPQEASVGERLLSGFKSIVRVRRTDHAPGDTSTEATIARTEVALKEGRLADALSEAKKLSAKAAQPAAGWLKRLEERAAIDKALADLDASLKTSLAGGATPKSGTKQ